jgi:hypothetical protein
MESYRQRVHSEIIFAHLGICAQAPKQEKLSKRVVNLRLNAPKLEGVEKPFVVEKMVDRVGIEPTTSSMPWKYQGRSVLTAKDLRAGIVGKNRQNRRYLLPICYQN